MDRLQRAGATPEEIEHIQANPSLLQRFETLADQDIHEWLAAARKDAEAIEAEVEKAVDAMEGKGKAANGKAPSE